MLQCTVFAIDVMYVYIYMKKVTQEKAACFLVLAAAPWAGYNGCS